MVGVPDMKSGSPSVKSHSGHQLELFLRSLEFNSSVTLVNNQLVPPPLEIFTHVVFNLTYLFVKVDVWTHKYLPL